jgi:hypothetical protein
VIKSAGNLKSIQLMASAMVSVVFLTTQLLSQMTVTLKPGQSIQAAVNGHPVGTTFLISAGVYRQQSIVPKDGDIFIGSPGADLNGSAIVSGFKFDSTTNLWAAHVNAHPPTSTVGVCFNWGPMCKYPEDIYFDNTLFHRVPSLIGLASKQWYLDYSTDTVYLVDNPLGHVVEITSTFDAFSGAASHVTIRGLVIEKYANPALHGAIHTDAPSGQPGRDWVIEHNEVRDNHAAGIRADQGTQILHNNIHHNGEAGILAAGDGVLVQGNWIAYNNTVGYNFAAAGGKFNGTTNLVVRNNYVHHNNGPGLKTDHDSYNTLYEYNFTSHNQTAGIAHEISFDAVIRYNTIVEDGYDPSHSGVYWGAGIFNQNSSNVEVYGNTVTNSMHGITATQTSRFNKNGVPYLVRNFNVHDNVITQQKGIVAGIAGVDSVYSQNNYYRNNSYTLPSITGSYFLWMNKAIDQTTWNAYGQF